MTARDRSLPLKPLGAELIGTALLVAVGLSMVIADFGQSSPVARLIPDEAARRFITGFLFGSTGALIALSPLGKASGAHINPAVTTRLLGPALISGDWHGWWVYWLGPLIGTLVAVAGYRFGGFDRERIAVANIWHFEHDPHGIFRHNGRAADGG